MDKKFCLEYYKLNRDNVIWFQNKAKVHYLVHFKICDLHNLALNISKYKYKDMNDNNSINIKFQI